MQIYNNFKECSFRIKNILVFGSFFNKGEFQSLCYRNEINVYLRIKSSLNLKNTIL